MGHRVYDYIFYTNVDAKLVVSTFVDKLSVFWPNLIAEVVIDRSVWEYESSLLNEMDAPLWTMQLHRDQIMFDEAEVTGGATTVEGDSMIHLFTRIQSVDRTVKNTRDNHDEPFWRDMVFVFNKVREFTLTLATDESSEFTQTVVPMFADCLREQVPEQSAP